MSRPSSSPPNQPSTESEVISTAYEVVTETSFAASTNDSMSNGSITGVLAGTKAGSMLGRTEAARTLGISVSTLRRVVENKIVSCVVDENGHHRFSAEDVIRARAVVGARKRRSPGAGVAPASPDIDGDLAATVAERLDGGASPIDVVKELRVSPNEVEPIVQWWRSHHDGIWVTAA